MKLTLNELRDLGYVSRRFVLMHYLKLSPDDIQAVERELELSSMTPLLRFAAEVFETDEKSG